MHNNDHIPGGRYIDRDISWLSFNERVLEEAASAKVPLLERLKFLSIYSSNLDEFYRVRMPALLALDQIGTKSNSGPLRETVHTIISKQLEHFGRILREELIPLLREQGITLLYGQPVPEALKPALRDYFLDRVAAFLQPLQLEAGSGFFPENNKIYLATFPPGNTTNPVVIPIPAAECGRFFSIHHEGIHWIILLDDLIREHLDYLVPGAIKGDAWSFKVTRDAALELADEFEGDLAEKIERQIQVRDAGLATRMLCDQAMPEQLYTSLLTLLQLPPATRVTGGRYHNLKDLADIPVKQAGLSYTPWPSVRYPLADQDLFTYLDRKDILLHVPYHHYNTLLQFFNRAAIDPFVTEIFVTLYRIAGDSLIANALISAARNGKQVTVFVELKARFDEANNIRWGKQMKAAGVKIIYSIPGLKVHAKVALIKRTTEGRSRYYGVLATGNFNESTARFYTDHILITANKKLLQELELLFLFLAKRRKPEAGEPPRFQTLLVAQFNLQQEFLRLLDREISNAKQGLPAAVTIKLNNLEEERMIDKLYEASQAGVSVRLIIRGICRIRPGIPGLSENIRVIRIVDRYLEHGRLFIFHHAGQPEVYLGSADWMRRNIYHRIEVCFPVYDPALKQQLIQLAELQLQDTASAVTLDAEGRNQPLATTGDQVPVQALIYQTIREEPYV